MEESLLDFVFSARKDYALHSLDEENALQNPFDQFQQWLKEAIDAQLEEPYAMVLSTVGADGKPSSRVVLLRKYSAEQGFVFFTNYLSRKGQELAMNPNACLLFFWQELERQVRIEGVISKVSPELSDEYFASRPLPSQLGAIVSPQSQKIPNKTFLLEKLDAIDIMNYKPKRPEHWGGYSLQPHYFEFWQGRPSRLHDRLIYELQPDSSWKLSRLAP